jgi:hypothetical protein
MATLRAARIEYADADALVDDYHERGWTDGLPVVPPTPDRVDAFLAAGGVDPDDVVGAVPTREVVVTAEDVAINAVMAGCLPSYAPVVLAACRAHLSEKGNCHSTTGTLSGAAHAVIVNGPIAGRIGVHGGLGCLGPGFRANATIGRALRLVIRNVCKAVPGFLDRASFSTPMRYSFCFAEDEGAVPEWRPLHVQRGFDAARSAVTVASVMRCIPSTDFESRTATAIVDGWAATLRHWGFRGDDFLGDGTSVVLVVGPEHRRYLVEEGWTKERAQEHLFPVISAPTTGPTDKQVNVARPEQILLVAAGGPGMAETWVLFPHLAWAITEAVVEP